jgi:hypothetical protein
MGAVKKRKVDENHSSQSRGTGVLYNETVSILKDCSVARPRNKP